MSLPLWITDLDSKDINFVRDFVLASGSLKKIAEDYSCSYPTVRARLNKIIEKIRLSDTQEDEQYVNLIRHLAIEDKISFEAAEILIKRYREEKDG